MHGVVSMDCSSDRKKLLLVARSINGLLWVSQWCPRTREQEPSSGVTWKCRQSESPVWKRGERVIARDCFRGSVEKTELERRDRSYLKVDRR